MPIASPEPPPKARIAAIAALTLALGLAAGLTLGGSRTAVPIVEVEGAEAVEVRCDDGRARARGSRVALLADDACVLHADLGGGTTLSVPVDLRGVRGYRCRALEGELRCTGS